MRGRPFSTPFLLNTRPAISGQGSPAARLSRVFRKAFFQKGRQLRAAALLMPPPCTRSRRVRRPARGGGGRFSVLPFCPLPFFPTPFCRADPGAGREANAPPRGFPGFFARPFCKKADSSAPLRPCAAFSASQHTEGPITNVPFPVFLHAKRTRLLQKAPEGDPLRSSFFQNQSARTSRGRSNRTALSILSACNVQPAACRCPPPPSAAATAATSASVERSEAR